jgi:hypothetical protein
MIPRAPGRRIQPTGRLLRNGSDGIALIIAAAQMRGLTLSRIDGIPPRMTYAGDNFLDLVIQ